MSTVCEEIQPQQDVPDLIPARMLNEFAYCPRLAYLEWVQGEFADNLETHEGRFGHRRVDKPDRREVPGPETIGPHPGPLPEGEGTIGPHPNPLPEREGTSRPHPGPLPEGEGTVGPHPNPLPEGEGTTALTLALSQRERGRAALTLTLSQRERGREALTLTRAREGEGTEDAEVEPMHSRSVTLSAPVEGLIAKIDVLDLENSVAVPIDYKRGRVPDVPGNAWEPEQVQLCTQGLILRRTAINARAEFLLHRIPPRVSIPFDNALVDRTRELIGQMRAMALLDSPPPPLDDSPKCPRCSLVGICLPDETNLLAGEPGEDRGKIRRLLPARDDALPLYVQEQGCTVGKSGDQLTVSKRGQVLRKIRLLDVSQVCLFGNAQLTAQALRETSAAGIPTCHFSYGGWFHALTSGLVHKNVELRMRQFAVAADPHRSLRFARRWIVGKIKNSRTLLRRHLPKEARQALVELKQLGQRACADDQRGDPVGHRRHGGQGLFRRLRSTAEGRPRLRPRRPQPPPATRPGQRDAIVRLCDAGQGVDGRAARGGLRPHAGLLSPAALRAALSWRSTWPRSFGRCWPIRSC